jgi:hypothetical protein
LTIGGAIVERALFNILAENADTQLQGSTLTPVVQASRIGYAPPSNVWRVAMAKGQTRSNKEKKKPKQDKNKKKGAKATSLFNPVSSYASQYGKKHLGDTIRPGFFEEIRS